MRDQLVKDPLPPIDRHPKDAKAGPFPEQALAFGRDLVAEMTYDDHARLSRRDPLRERPVSHGLTHDLHVGLFSNDPFDEV
jgi:hypothetical protein